MMNDPNVHVERMYEILRTQLRNDEAFVAFDQLMRAGYELPHVWRVYRETQREIENV